MALLKKHPEAAPVRAEVVTVTPEIAADWLAKNIKNRTMDDRHVRWLAEQMKAGRWQLNGETIVLGAYGELLDGQHRLAAVVMSNTSIVSLVAYNAERDSFKTMNTGKRRSVSASLGILGERDIHALASVIGMYRRWERAQMTGYIGSLTVDEAVDTLADHPDLREAVKVAGRIRKRLPINGTAAALCWYIITRKHPEDSGEFFDALASGVGLEDGDPVLLLRDRIIANNTAKMKMTAEEVAALTIKAWNYWRVGRKVHQLAWRPRGGETFPEVI